MEKRRKEAVVMEVVKSIEEFYHCFFILIKTHLN